MNQKKLSQLDPKLKATYERIVGKPLPKKLSSEKQKVAKVPEIKEDTSVHVFKPITDSSANVFSLTIDGKKSLINPLYIIGGIIFFVLYALLWAALFHLPLPFKLPF